MKSSPVTLRWNLIWKIDLSSFQPNLSQTSNCTLERQVSEKYLAMHSVHITRRQYVCNTQKWEVKNIRKELSLRSDSSGLLIHLTIEALGLVQIQAPGFDIQPQIWMCAFQPVRTVPASEMHYPNEHKRHRSAGVVLLEATSLTSITRRFRCR